MNAHGRHAMQIIRTRDPLGYAQIADPEAHFSNLGREIQTRIWLLSEELMPTSGNTPAHEYDELVIAVTVRAQELVYQNLIDDRLPPPPETSEPNNHPGQD